MINVLATHKSKYQHIIITESNGKKELFLDNAFQTQYNDSDYYNILLCGASKYDKVLILGGGDLTGISVLYRKEIKNWKLVEIDEDIIHLSKLFCPVKYEKYKDNIIIEDAFKFIKNTDEKFDVILIDLLSFVELNKLSRFITCSEFLNIVSSKTNKYFAGFVESRTRGVVIANAIRKYLLDNKLAKEVYLAIDNTQQSFFVAAKEDITISESVAKYMVGYNIKINVPEFISNNSLEKLVTFFSAY